MKEYYTSEKRRRMAFEQHVAGLVTRERIRDFLMRHPAAKSVDVARYLGLSQAAIVRHMRALRNEWAHTPRAPLPNHALHPQAMFNLKKLVMVRYDLDVSTWEPAADQRPEGDGGKKSPTHSGVPEEVPLGSAADVRPRALSAPGDSPQARG